MKEDELERERDWLKHIESCRFHLELMRNMAVVCAYSAAAAYLYSSAERLGGATLWRCASFLIAGVALKGGFSVSTLFVGGFFEKHKWLTAKGWSWVGVPLMVILLFSIAVIPPIVVLKLHS